MSGKSELQYVTFGLGEETFAVPVQIVREILDYERPTSLPGAPSYVLGLRDVRGRGVQIVDLRRKLGMPLAEVTALTRILVVDVELLNGPIALGIVADQVFGVESFWASDIEPPPELLHSVQQNYIAGVVLHEGKFVVLLDAATAIVGGRRDAFPWDAVEGA